MKAAVHRLRNQRLLGELNGAPGDRQSRIALRRSLNAASGVVAFGDDDGRGARLPV